MSGDVADTAFCKEAVKRTVEAFGKLDILVNNAAFQEHVNSFEELTDEHFDRTLKTNLSLFLSSITLIKQIAHDVFTEQGPHVQKDPDWVPSSR